MYTKSTLKEQCQQILEDNGGKIADKASRILLEDPALNNLRPPLEFISKNWRDPLTPSMMSLSCKTVGGQSSATHEAALAMSLMNLSFYIWDDIIDKAPFKQFKPTLFGKFGEGAALMIGGLASAKAFSILNQMDLDRTKRQTITKLFWNLWTRMAKAETANLQLRSQENVPSRKKLLVIKTEAAANLETCLKIGASLGNGSEDEINHLGKYGFGLGIILELWKDLYVSFNLTLELAEKIKSGALPYSLMWTSEHSEKIRKKLENLAQKEIIEPSAIKEIVENTLQTKALHNTLKIVRKFTKKAKDEVSYLKTKNRATQTLQLFVEAQPRLVSESLLTLQS
jgi:geranylgeranyl pyrophosphate synthase